MEEKPWLDLVPYDGTNWWIASHNKYFHPDYASQNLYLSDSPAKLFRAYVIMSDGSIGGSYFRYFYWTFDSNHRYFFTYSKWLFDKPLNSLKNGDIVTQIVTKQKYVVNDKFGVPYYKIFESITE
jgi:hypothetical protein